MPWVNEEELSGAEPSKKEVQEVRRYLARKKTLPRFYADENFPPRATALLRAGGFDVVTAAEAGKLGHPDENHAAEALRLERVLVTCDRDYLNDRRFPIIHCPAIVVFDFGAGTRTEILRAFRCLRWMIAIPQFYDKWAKLHARPGEWSEHFRYLDGSESRQRCRWHRGKRQVWVG